MKLNNRFIFGILSLLLAAVIAFVALPTIARQTNGKEEIVRISVLDELKDIYNCTYDELLRIL